MTPESQMALAWVLRHKAMTSVLIGASKAEQIEDAVGTLNNLNFTTEELQKIEGILKEWVCSCHCEAARIR